MTTNLQPLIDVWKIAKQHSDKAKEDLLTVETSIIKVLGDELKKGTNNFGELKITCSNSERWDQLEIASARNSWPSTVPFPFVSEYQPDNKQISYIKEHNPEAYKLLEKALSISPKKAAFSIKKEKE